MKPIQSYCIHVYLRVRQTTKPNPRQKMFSRQPTMKQLIEGAKIPSQMSYRQLIDAIDAQNEKLTNLMMRRCEMGSTAPIDKTISRLNALNEERMIRGTIGYDQETR